MSKIFLASCIMLLLFSARSSAQKSTWMIYGDGTYDNTSVPAGTSTIGGNSSTTWNINPGIGYMVSDHFMVGVQGGYGSQQVEGLWQYGIGSNSLVKVTATNWQAGIFGRYTTALSKRFYVYTQLYVCKNGVSTNPSGASQNVYPVNYPYNTIPDEGNGELVSLLPGAGVNLMRGYGIHADIGGITYTSFNPYDGANVRHFNVTLGQQFTFGIHKVLGWKKLTTPKGAPAENTVK